MRPHSTVHPRSRGEHVSPSRALSVCGGSSPLARGTPRRGARRPHSPRFIPARAGNTGKSWATRFGPAVHPRSRGEHSPCFAERLRNGGSSPLARGTQSVAARRARERRFIPARAGNTAPAAPGTGSSTVHPRSRGEHTLRRSRHTLGTGSSPLARGTPWHRRGKNEPHRFIPARAGNTPSPTSSVSSSSVHPRSRGEHTGWRSLTCRAVGSSPLARGTPRRGEKRAAGGRFIPARAGNTGRAMG